MLRQAEEGLFHKLPRKEQPFLRRKPSPSLKEDFNRKAFRLSKPRVFENLERRFVDLIHLHGAQRGKSGTVHPDRCLIRDLGLRGTAPFQFAASSGSFSAGFFTGIRIRQRPDVSIIDDPEFP